MATVEGTTTDKFSALRDVLTDLLDSGQDVGASVAVYHHGELVVDLWGGYLDAAKSAPWQPDTICNVYSTTKTMTFLSILLLVDRGELDLDQKVAHYWPEFAAGGKSDITIKNLLGHTAGLAGWDEPLVAHDLADWNKCTSLLAAQTPWWSDRTQSGYHAVTQGFLLGEVINRITGTTIGRFFKSEIAEPLGADFSIGVSEQDDSRACPLIAPDMSALPPFPEDSLAYRTLLNPNMSDNPTQYRWWRAAEIPAANGHGNARSVAKVQSVISGAGASGDVRLLKASTVEKIFDVQADGTDLVLSMPVRFGLGYGLSNPMLPMGPRTCWWAGFGGSIVINDLDAELTVAYVMNKMNVGVVADARGFSRRDDRRGSSSVVTLAKRNAAPATQQSPPAASFSSSLLP